MEQNLRNNLIELANIYINSDTFNDIDNSTNFTKFLYQELFDIDIEESGYGQDYSTRQMTNNLGDLKIYKEDDTNKIKYIEDILPGDLLFFHTKDITEKNPSPNNKYPGSVGIYIGKNTYINYQNDTGKIMVESIDDNINKLVASRNIIKYILK